MDSRNEADDLSDDEFDVEKNTSPDVATVIQRLKEFTYYLVENIEFNLNFCLQLLEERVVPPKTNSLHVTALGLLFSAIPKIGGGISTALKTGESTIFRKIEKKNSKILADLVYYFSDNKEKLRSTVIDAAVEVFSSFESQFMKLSCNGGEKRAMQKLAIDASDRIFNYFLMTEQSKDVTKTEIIKGIIYGDSKRNRGGKKEGKSVSANEIKWKTCKLYPKVGIVIVERNLFYKNDNTKPQKYGYRRLFSWEDEDDIMSNWTLDNHFETTKYTLDITEDLLKDVKEYIMTKTPNEEAKLDRQKYNEEAINDRQEKYTETLKVLKECFNTILDQINEVVLKVTANTDDNRTLLETVAKKQEEENKKQAEIVQKLELVHVDVLETKGKQEILVITSETIQNDIVEIKNNQDEMATAVIKPEVLEEIIRSNSKESAKEGLKELVRDIVQNTNFAPIIRNGIEITIPKIREGVERTVPKIDIKNDTIDEVKKQIVTSAPRVQEELEKTIQRGEEELNKVKDNLRDLFKF